MRITMITGQSITAVPSFLDPAPGAVPVGQILKGANWSRIRINGSCEGIGQPAAGQSRRAEAGLHQPGQQGRPRTGGSNAAERQPHYTERLCKLVLCGVGLVALTTLAQHSSITADGARALAEALQESKSLRTLILGVCLLQL